MPRLFVAIDLPKAHRAHLTALADPNLPARWTPSEQLHLTLRFVGDVEGEAAVRVEQALDEVAGAPFDLIVSGLGVFPSIRKPRVLYAGIEHEPLLIDLQEQVELHVRAAGLGKADKPFSPHVTLARLRRPDARAVRAFKKAHADVALPPFRVDAFVLYESELRPEGALHTPRAAFKLAG